MLIGSVIIICGFLYACACRLSSGVTELGINRGRRMGLFCLVLGIGVELYMRTQF